MVLQSLVHWLFERSGTTPAEEITILCSIALIVTIDTLFAPTLFLMVSLRLEDVFALLSTF